MPRVAHLDTLSIELPVDVHYRVDAATIHLDDVCIGTVSIMAQLTPDQLRQVYALADEAAREHAADSWDDNDT